MLLLTSLSWLSILMLVVIHILALPCWNLEAPTSTMCMYDANVASKVLVSNGDDDDGDKQDHCEESGSEDDQDNDYGDDHDDDDDYHDQSS